MVSPPLSALVCGGSAGAITALQSILPKLPAEYPPVLCVVHLLPGMPSLLASIFADSCAMRVVEAESGLPIERGVVYFAPADYHLLVEDDGRCALSLEPPVHYSRPAIDPLFDSAAEAYASAVAGVVLTGASEDGAAGLAAIARRGGLAFVQDPATAEMSVMPRAALSKVPAARSLPLDLLAQELVRLGSKP